MRPMSMAVATDIFTPGKHSEMTKRSTTGRSGAKAISRFGFSGRSGSFFWMSSPGCTPVEPKPSLR